MLNRMFFCQAQETGCFCLLRICRVKHARKVGSTNKVTFLKIGKLLVIPQASNVPNAEKWHIMICISLAYGFKKTGAVSPADSQRWTHLTPENIQTTKQTASCPLH